MAWLRKLASGIIIVTLLSSCHLIFHPNVEQGNIIGANQIAAIHLGMSKQQVEQILGFPVLKNLYANNQLVYVYTMIPGRGKPTKKQLLINFSNGHVTSINTNIPPQS